MSSLHCWIRTFEYLLHLGYKNEIKKFQACTTKEKQSVIRMKDLIKRRCREELSLVVDSPRQGCGNSNTGNTARRALGSAEIFGDIIGVDKDIIIRLRNILQAVCSGFPLDIERFKAYCFATSEVLVNHYGWYTIPPSVHKLLEHSYVIASYFNHLSDFTQKRLRSVNIRR